jgi:hypothetical protein
MSDKKTNLFKALSKFIEAMRLYLYTGLNNQYGAAWERKYFESLHHSKTEHWGMRLQEGIDPIQLIDYGNLKDFAIQNKNFFEKDFGSQKNALPTFFGQISEARNMINHYGIYINDKAEKAYLHMIEIAQKLEMNELENDLRKLKDNSFNHYVIPTKSTKSTKTTKTTSSDNRLKKPDAIKLINNSLDYDKISNANTVYSNINKAAPCWWLNIPPAKFNNSLNILLVEEDELIWINLPKGSCYPPENIFNTRNDNGKVDLRIGTEGVEYLKDYLSANNFDFKPYVKNKLKI